jgi:hypothetical protein
MMGAHDFLVKQEELFRIGCRRHDTQPFESAPLNVGLLRLRFPGLPSLGVDDHQFLAAIVSRHVDETDAHGTVGYPILALREERIRRSTIRLRLGRSVPTPHIAAEGDAADRDSIVGGVVVCLPDAGQEMLKLNPVKSADRAALVGRDEEMLFRVGGIAEDEPLTPNVSKLLREAKLFDWSYGRGKDLPDRSMHRTRWNEQIERGRKKTSPSHQL